MCVFITWHVTHGRACEGFYTNAGQTLQRTRTEPSGKTGPCTQVKGLAARTHTECPKRTPLTQEGKLHRSGLGRLPAPEAQGAHSPYTAEELTASLHTLAALLCLFFFCPRQFLSLSRSQR